VGSYREEGEVMSHSRLIEKAVIDTLGLDEDTHVEMMIPVGDVKQGYWIVTVLPETRKMTATQLVEYFMEQYVQTEGIEHIKPIKEMGWIALYKTGGSLEGDE
jgi:hypothetical protein